MYAYAREESYLDPPWDLMFGFNRKQKEIQFTVRSAAIRIISWRDKNCERDKFNLVVYFTIATALAVEGL